MADMTGKRVIVTGATSGIGEEAAVDLAKMGAAVTLISRNADKLAATAARIRDVSSADVDTIQADLSEIAQIRAAAAEYLSRHNRLDVLLNNAGGVFQGRRESADGIEYTMALNHISYFLLTYDLLNLLKQTAATHGEARIVNVSSEAHRSGMNWDDLQYQQSYSALNAYGQSKAMNVLHAYELARRLEGTGVTANAVHPGLVATGFARNNGCLFVAVASVLQVFAKSASEGAATSVYVASDPAVKGVTGKYFADKREKETIPETYDKGNGARLWAVSEALTGLKASAAAS
jgi:retinol dehydrogenase 12